MRVLVDEDTAVQVVPVLRHLLPRHEIRHITDIGWTSKKDRPVLRDAARAGYQVFLTKDRNQLDDPAECSEIKRSKLHHVRYSQRQQGLRGLGLALGAIISAMPLVVEELERADGQRLVRINGLDPTRRFEMVDPARKPPSYWPR